jgi:hypothetical protein
MVVRNPVDVRAEMYSLADGQWDRGDISQEFDASTP